MTVPYDQQQSSATPPAYPPPTYPPAAYPPQQDPYPQTVAYADQAPPPVYGAPDYGPPAPAPARRGTVSWVGLFIALIGTVGVGVAGWACLATIQFTVTPFEIAQWWFIVLIVASVLPIVALIVCIAGLVMGRSRLVAVVGIIIAVIAPAVSVGTGLTLGTNTLINRAGEAAANSSDLVTDMFDGADVDPWVRDLLNSLQTYSEGYH